MNTTPPRLQQHHRYCATELGPSKAVRPGWGPVYAAVALAVAAVLVRLLGAWGVPLPGCGFRAATGITCVGCGSTRAVLALSHGEWLSAWTLNPAATLAASAVFAAGVVGLLDRTLGTRLLDSMRHRLRGPRLVWAIALGLTLNWAYLIVAGRS